MSYFIIIDAGTTNLRVSLLDEAWQPLAQASDEAGVSHTAIDGNNGRLCNGIRTCVRQVMDSAGITAQDVRLCAAYGMITSDVGLMEIPHLAAPAGPAQFHAGLVTCEFPDLLPFPVTFIPGLKNTTEPVTLDRLCNVDMMRGEETEAHRAVDRPASQPRSDAGVAGQPQQVYLSGPRRQLAGVHDLYFR